MWIMRVRGIVRVSSSEFCVWVNLVDEKRRMKRMEYGGCGEESKNICGGGNVSLGLGGEG